MVGWAVDPVSLGDPSKTPWVANAAEALWWGSRIGVGALGALVIWWGVTGFSGYERHAGLRLIRRERDPNATWASTWGSVVLCGARNRRPR